MGKPKLGVGLTEIALEPLRLPRPGYSLDNRQERPGEGRLTQEKGQDGAGSEPQGGTTSVHLPNLLFSLSQSSNTSPLSSPDSYFMVSFSFTENMEAAR